MSTDRVGIRLQVDIDVLQWFTKQGAHINDYRDHMALTLRRHVDTMLEIEAAVAEERQAVLPLVTSATVEEKARGKPLLEEIGKLWLLLTPAERQRFRQNDGWTGNCQ